MQTNEVNWTIDDISGVGQIVKFINDRSDKWQDKRGSEKGAEAWKSKKVEFPAKKGDTTLPHKAWLIVIAVVSLKFGTWGYWPQVPVILKRLKWVLWFKVSQVIGKSFSSRSHYWRDRVIWKKEQVLTSFDGQSSLQAARSLTIESWSTTWNVVEFCRFLIAAFI